MESLNYSKLFRNTAETVDRGGANRETASSDLLEVVP